MDLRRVRVWEWLTGLAGVVLLVSLFLPWYGVEPAEGVSGAVEGTTNAWDAFTVIDVILALAALGAIALPVIAAAQRTAAVPQSWTALVMPLLILGAVLAL